MGLEARNVKNTSELRDYIGKYYQLFLGRFKEKTAINYKTDLNMFFLQVYGKKSEHVTISDVESTTMLDAMMYYQWLTEDIESKDGIIRPRYKNASVNRKLNAIKSFFRFLNTQFDTIDEKIFRNCDSKNPELDSEGWDGLDWEEAISIWEYAEEHYGNEIASLFKLASITSVRLDALINSTWEDSWFIKKENGVSINYIEVVDKSKKHKKPISSKLFNELQEKLGSTGRLFPTLYPTKVGKILKEVLTELNFDPRRNIKFHSFKKAGVMRSLEKTGNMYKAKEQGNHSSMTTAEKYYLKYKECLMDMTSYTMDLEVNISEELSEYSNEELLGAIEQLSDGAKYELLRILEKK